MIKVGMDLLWRAVMARHSIFSQNLLLVRQDSKLSDAVRVVLS